MKYGIITLFLILFAAAQVSAQSTDDTIVLGTVENLPPYSYYVNNRLTGLDIEVVKTLFRQIGRNIKIRPLPWARVLAELKSGAIDGAFSFYYSAERENYAVYMGPVHFDNLGIMVRKGDEFTYRNIKDLYGKTIVKGRGVFVSREFDDAEKNGLIKVDEILDTNMGNIRMLMSKRVDCAIGVAETMLHYSRILGDEDSVSIISNLIDPMRPGYLVLSKNSSVNEDSELKDKIIKTIKQINQDGTLMNLYRKFGFDLSASMSMASENLKKE